MPAFMEFDLDEEKLAKRVYAEAVHRTICWGLLVEAEVRQELEGFLSDYIAFLGAPPDQFFRLDAFVTEVGLTIIEINAELQDGWGVALNLLRASGVSLTIPTLTRMPSDFVDHGDGHRQEFDLACSEFAILGHSCRVIEQLLKPGEHPEKSEYDSKLHLARFRHHWAGQYVQVPMMYSSDFANWESIPPGVVFKFAKKYGPEAQSAGYSVIPFERVGKGRFLRQCYQQATLIAQERQKPVKLDDGSLTQAVILCSGMTPVTGYLQVAPPETFIINDRTAATGPLVFE